MDCHSVAAAGNITLHTLLAIDRVQIIRLVAFELIEDVSTWEIH